MTFPLPLLFIDLETTADFKKISRIGIYSKDLISENLQWGESAFEALEKAAEGMAAICGHNIVAHDLELLRRYKPDSKIFEMPVIDTLLISPVAFPKNPYHKLVKDYKLVTFSRNDPLKDCVTCEKLLYDQVIELVFADEKREYARFLAAMFASGDSPAERGSYLFFDCTGLLRLNTDRLFESISAQGIFGMFECSEGSPPVCKTRFFELFEKAMASNDPYFKRSFAYAVSWIGVADDSILSPWVYFSHPDTEWIIESLREPGDCDCKYCRMSSSPEAYLNDFFGFEKFKPNQEAVVKKIIAGKNVLALMPTSGGKSLCYQLPAMIMATRRKLLTVVISPLQALMKDQVDVLRDRFAYQRVAAIYGGLSAPERKSALEGIALGSIDIVYAAPEQLRNRSFVETIMKGQIGMFVIDEAHCISKWGHDFRPDYMYVPKFIAKAREKFTKLQVCFFTATAKQDVIIEIIRRFSCLADPTADNDSGGAQNFIEVVDGGHERDNLSYEVVMTPENEKGAKICELIKESGGCAIVYAASRKRVEYFAGALNSKGIECDYYHAGRLKDKKEIQDRFTGGALSVITATNAFGMGIDKPDVRLVIHADIPGSLENYIQEAGRAGRDGAMSRCVLLFNPEDAERQFLMQVMSKVSERDIRGVYRGLASFLSRRRKNLRDLPEDEIVATSGEILADDGTDADFDLDDAMYDIKVKTIIAALEEAHLVERLENRISFVNVSFLMPDLPSALEALNNRQLSGAVKERYERVLEYLYGPTSGDGKTFHTDSMSALTGIDSSEIIKILRHLNELSILSSAVQFSAYYSSGVKNDSYERLERIRAIESVLLEMIVRDTAIEEDEVDLCLEGRNSFAYQIDINGIYSEQFQSREDISPDAILQTLYGMRDIGAIKLYGTGRKKLYLKRLMQIRDIESDLKERYEAAHSILKKLWRLTNGCDGQDVYVIFSESDLCPSAENDSCVSREKMEKTLLFMHERGIIKLQNGLGIFNPAMHIRVKRLPEPDFDFRKAFDPLDKYYEQKIAFIHMILKYAYIGISEKVESGFGLLKNYISDYFSSATDSFIDKYFETKREREILKYATDAATLDKISGSLNNPVQERIVSYEGNRRARLVVAGPGSGKTRSIVHRIAYLIKVLRNDPRTILVVAFNRQAVLQIRRELRKLIGRVASRVDIYTYHALAMAICGKMPPELKSEDGTIDFNRVLEDAVKVLDGIEVKKSRSDEWRSYNFHNYTHILVDEYQDINDAEYRLVSLIAEKNKKAHGTVKLLAVGDDDQNIYSFNGSNVRFIRCFEEDYNAEIIFMSENYRSTKNIVEASNAVISANRDRMKKDSDRSVVNRAREKSLPGGRLEEAEECKDRGRVVIARVADQKSQALSVASQIDELIWECGFVPERIAVLSRTNSALDAVAAACGGAGIATRRFEKNRLPLYGLREIALLMDHLRAAEQKPVSAVEIVSLINKFYLSLEINIPEAFRAEFESVIEAFCDEHEGILAAPEQFVSYVYDYARSGGDGGFTKPGVALATMHTVKGLEFDAVIIIDELFKIQSVKIEEERRLFYVAMTRAREALFVYLFDGHENDIVAPLLKMPVGVVIVRRGFIKDGFQDLPTVSREFVETLDISDIYIGYAKLNFRPDELQRRLEKLSCGEPLMLVRKVKDGKSRYYISYCQEFIGALSRRCAERFDGYIRSGYAIDKAFVHGVFRVLHREGANGESRSINAKPEKLWAVVPAVGFSVSK